MAEIELQSNSGPSLRWKKAIIPAALVLFAFYGSTHMVAAGDTWVALACGRHFANHGVDTVEPFSFNSHPAGPSEEQLAAWPKWTHGMIRYWLPTGWINQNWLTHLTFYKLVTWFGSDGKYNYNALVYWKYALFGLTVFVVFALGKVVGAGDFLSMAAACLAMVVGRTFYDIRPACYSNLLVPVFILLLALSTYRHSKYIWLMIPLIIFWANVHGGYIYAYIMVVPFLGTHILLNLPRRWTVAVGLSGLWMVLFLLSYKYHTHTYFLQTMRLTEPDYEKMSLVSGALFTGGVLAAMSFFLAALRNIPAGLFYGYHVIVSFIYPVILFASHPLNIPSGINPSFMRILNHFMTSNLVGFLLMLILGGLVIVLTAVSKDRFVRISNKTIGHIIGASAVSFLAMIVFNPFHLTNLTHTFEITISEHAASWRAVNEWRPAFDWMDPTTDRVNRVGEEEWYGVMCIVGLAAMATWAVFHLLKPRQRPLRKGPRQALAATESFASSWPRIDMALILVGLLTMYMAFQSRRFIALAGPSASPVLALLVMQLWQMYTARRNWMRGQVLEPASVPFAWQKIAWLVTAGFLAAFGLFVGLKYYRIYESPWPSDDERDSVFMRMTASHQKPFEVCDFINANKLTGRIFNYWTEGGALAFGQIPDPETGKTPLQHFMDGRAQAAFDHDIFKLWQTIFSGGPVAEQAMRQGRNPSAEELQRIGEWINHELKTREVWLVLMPRTQAGSTFMRGLQRAGNWKTTFINEKQHLLVDTESDQGRQLVDRILEDQAVFADPFSKPMTLFRLAIETRDPRQNPRLFEYAEAAFRAKLYPLAMITLTQVARSPYFREQAEAFMRAYLENFRNDYDALTSQSGYQLRLASAVIAAKHLASQNPTDEQELVRLAEEWEQRSEAISSEFIW